MRVYINFLITIITFSLFVISCTQPYYHVFGSYKNKKIKTGKFVIFSPTYDFSETLQDDIITDFGDKNTDQLFKDFFYDKLIHALYLESNYDKSIYAPDLPVRKSIMEIKNLPKKTNLLKRVLTVYDTLNINLMLPKDSEKIQFSDKVDYVLVMDTIKMFYSTDTLSGSSYTPGMTFSTSAGNMTTPGTFGGGGGPQHFLIMSTQYAIWDNNKGKIIIFGKGLAKSRLKRGKIKTLENTIEELATVVLYGSPFSWR